MDAWLNQGSVFRNLTFKYVLSVAEVLLSTVWFGSVLHEEMRWALMVGETRRDYFLMPATDWFKPGYDWQRMEVVQLLVLQPVTFHSKRLLTLQWLFFFPFGKFFSFSRMSSACSSARTGLYFLDECIKRISSDMVPWPVPLAASSMTVQQHEVLSLRHEQWSLWMQCVWWQNRVCILYPAGYTEVMMSELPHWPVSVLVSAIILENFIFTVYYLWCSQSIYASEYRI